MKNRFGQKKKGKVSRDPFPTQPLKTKEKRWGKKQFEDMLKRQGKKPRRPRYPVR